VVFMRGRIVLSRMTVFRRLDDGGAGKSIEAGFSAIGSRAGVYHADFDYAGGGYWRDDADLQRGGRSPAEAAALSASGAVDRGLVYHAEGEYQRPEYVSVFLLHCT